MTPFKQRLAAVLTALLLLLGTLPALAEAPAAQLPNMEVDIKAELNPMLGSLIAGFTGGQQDEASQNMITTLISAFNKLNTHIITGQAGVSGSIGTELGSLLDFQAAVNPETKEALATTNLLPGLSLTLDPKILEKLNPQGSIPKVTPQQMHEMAAPYLDAIAKLAQEHEQDATVEEGEFNVEGYGVFNKRTEFVFTSHMAAQLLGRLGEVYKTDDKLKVYLDEVVKASQAGQVPAEGAEAAEPMNLGEELVKASEKGLSEPNEPWLNVVCYQDGMGKTYFDAVTPEGVQSAAKIDLLLDGAGMDMENGSSQVRLKMLTANPDQADFGAAPETEPAAEPAPTDWLALEQAILSGSNYRDTLINLQLDSTKEAGRMSGSVSLGLVTSGLSLGLALESSNNPETFESDTLISLTFMFPEPMVKITVKARPAQGEPLAPVLEGAAPLVISEGELAEEDNARLEAALQQGMPALIARLNAVLPEEAPALLALMQGGAPETQAPAPVPEGTVVETEETPAQEAVEAPEGEAVEVTEAPVEETPTEAPEEPVEETPAVIVTEAPEETPTEAPAAP